MIDTTPLKFVYGPIVRGEVYRLYVFDSDGLHSGGRLFSHRASEDVGMDTVTAAEREIQARFKGCETRVTNLLDELVFYTRNGEILHPPGMTGGQFWSSV